ncbi:MAG: response regulator transcription factor [Acidobacteriota bacterium]|nr:response regulator transcription factor [Acidobacteriota bacterium]
MSETAEKIRVILADDHPIFRQGLMQVVGRNAEVEIVGEAEDGAAALDLIEQLQPQVAVLDIDMPKKNGFAVAQTAREQKLPTNLIFLTMYKEEDAFNRALDLGVKGYVLKDSAVTEIVAAIKAAAAGQHYISPIISTFLINRSSRIQNFIEQTPGLASLTQSERRLLKLIAANKTTKEIADELFISPRTVDNHRANICQKLNLKGSHALLKFAFDHKSELT